jgi:hypothetical protein
MKISKIEPAERPLTLALSSAEVIAVARYHLRETKAVTRRFSHEAMVVSQSPLPQGRTLKAMRDQTLDQVTAHGRRASALLDLVKASLKA